MYFTDREKAEAITEIPVEKPSSAFTSLKKIISEVKQLNVEKNISGDIALSGAYDQICKSGRIWIRMDCKKNLCI